MNELNPGSIELYDPIDPAQVADKSRKERKAFAKRQVDRFLQFHSHAASFPWRSQAAWIAHHLGADAAGIEKAKTCFRADLFRQNLSDIGADMPQSSEKTEGAMTLPTSVASARGEMILSPDAFFCRFCYLAKKVQLRTR